MRVLVTGATGFVGRQLIPALLKQGHDVRALARRPGKLKKEPWASEVTLLRGDLLNLESLYEPLAGCEAAYYLVHSMYGGRGYAQQDRRCARNFVAAGEHLRRVIYLGGLTPQSAQSASQHLSSRAEVGAILREGLPTLEFQAGPVIGPRSASFEMIRHLVESLPVLFLTDWSRHKVSPIALSDMLRYLVASLGRAATGIVEVGSDAHAFFDLMRTYAQVRGLMRPVIPAPLVPPSLAALAADMITPLPLDITLPLTQGAVADLQADVTRARLIFPEIICLNYRQAVSEAIASSHQAA